MGVSRGPGVGVGVSGVAVGSETTVNAAVGMALATVVDRVFHNKNRVADSKATANAIAPRKTQGSKIFRSNFLISMNITKWGS